GRPDRGELPGELIHDRLDADRRGDAHHRDEVMAAGVADLGEGVIFLKDRDRWSGSTAFRVTAVARLDAAITARHVEPSTFEELGDAERGLALFIRELGLGVDRPRQREERIAPLVDRLD